MHREAPLLAQNASLYIIYDEVVEAWGKGTT